MSAHVGLVQAHESCFGPPSEPIVVNAFLDATRQLLGDGGRAHDGISVPTSPDQQIALAAECSVAEFKDSLEGVLTNPSLLAHVQGTHQAVVQSIFETVDSSSRRKRRKVAIPEPGDEEADVITLRRSMDNSHLNCWPLTLHAASFIRPPKHSDRNTIQRAKTFSTGTNINSVHEALVFVTIYNKLSWSHRQLLRLSHHVLLSSQTLGDLYNVIPCCSDDVLKDSGDEHYQSSGAVMYIDSAVYGDGRGSDNYAEKLSRLLNALPNDKRERPDLSIGTHMHDTTLNSLSLQLHKPYWLLHAGDCEHYLLIDQIRLHHSSDPPASAFPLTTHLTPLLWDLCRACNKVPAVYAVKGDVRLGESPFMICAACWKWMGEPDAEDVEVVPLLRHERGWEEVP